MKPFAHLPTILSGTAALAVLGIAACSKDTPNTAPGARSGFPQLGIPSADGSVVKSRAAFSVTTDANGRIIAIAPITAPMPQPTVSPDPSPVPSDEPSPEPSDLPSPMPSDVPSPMPSPTGSTTASFPIEVMNAANTSMTVDASEWTMPTPNNDVVDFGHLAISGLVDNNLRVCGNGTERCGSAQIRMYTTGTAGPGIWNEADQYGAPISASLAGAEPTGTVGLGMENALVLQTVAIPAETRVLRLEALDPAPRYHVTADFTDAGAGSYTTTLVLEYVLVP